MSNFTVPLLMNDSKRMLLLTGAWTSYEKPWQFVEIMLRTGKDCIMRLLECLAQLLQKKKRRHLFILPNLSGVDPPSPHLQFPQQWRRPLLTPTVRSRTSTSSWLLTLLLRALKIHFCHFATYRFIFWLNPDRPIYVLFLLLRIWRLLDSL
jgi:hypothetical protein